MNDYISVREAAERRQVSQTAIYKAIQDGRLTAERILGRLALHRAEIDAFQFGSYTGVKRARIARRTVGSKSERG